MWQVGNGNWCGTFPNQGKEIQPAGNVGGGFPVCDIGPGGDIPVGMLDQWKGIDVMAMAAEDLPVGKPAPSPAQAISAAAVGTEGNVVFASYDPCVTDPNRDCNDLWNRHNEGIDYATALGGSELGSRIGGQVGGPIGAFVGGAIGGAAGGIIQGFKALF